MIKIICVCGARPNFMKIAPIMRAFKAAGKPVSSQVGLWFSLLITPCDGVACRWGASFGGEPQLHKFRPVGPYVVRTYRTPEMTSDLEPKHPPATSPL